MNSSWATHYMRLYIAAEIYSEEVTGCVYSQGNFLVSFADLPRADKEAYVAKADARIIEFKQRYEKLAG